MSEEKLYAVKNDEGKYWEFEDSGFWRLEISDFVTTSSKKHAGLVAYGNGGHIVTFIEEPKKVALTKEQAEIVYNAHSFYRPATFISNGSCSDDEEELLMNAYVNGYTVEKEKKYMVELDGLVTTDGAKQYLTKKGGKWFASRIKPSLHQAFTDEELKLAPIWTQEINREEVDNYGMGC